MRKVEYAYNFWKCADAVDQKLSKLVHVSRNYSLRRSVVRVKDKGSIQKEYRWDAHISYTGC